MMMAPIAAPTPIRAVPRIVPTTIPTGIETTPAPTKAPIRAIETSRVGPPRTISIKPRIVPPIVGIPRRPPCVTNIYIHVYGSIRIIRIITIRVITIAHIKIDLVGPRDRNLARRMITNDSLRIFRIRATLGRKLLHVAIFLHIYHIERMKQVLAVYVDRIVPVFQDEYHAGLCHGRTGHYGTHAERSVLHIGMLFNIGEQVKAELI